MKKLHKFILKSYLGPFVLTFFIVIFVLLMQFLWKYIDDLVGKGLKMPVISELLLYTTASLVPMAIPLAVLLASLMCFGNLGENNELLALKSAGISLQRIMAPLIVLIIFITIGAFLFNNHVLPYANLKMRSLLYDIQKQNPELSIRPGIFDNTIQGYSIRIEEKVPGTSLLKGIQVYDHTSNLGNIIVTVADSGYIRQADETHLLFILYNGYTYNELQRQKQDKRVKSYPLRRDHFQTQEMVIELLDFGLQRTDENLFKNSYQMMNLSQLAYIEDTLKKEIVSDQRYLSNSLLNACLPKTAAIRPPVPVIDTVKSDTLIKEKVKEIKEIIPVDVLFNKLSHDNRIFGISRAINLANTARNYINNTYFTADSKIRRLRKYQIEEQKKFTLSLACFIFFFIGAPLGAIIRKGGLGMPVIVSVLFFILWYIISLSGEKFARESVISPFTGVWLSTFILIPLGILLTYKASKDSVILNLETYTKFFNKLINIIKKKTKITL